VDPGVYDRMLTGLDAYLQRHGLTDVNDVVGTLEFGGTAKGAAG
jgi:hypothetical protein